MESYTVSGLDTETRAFFFRRGFDLFLIPEKLTWNIQHFKIFYKYHSRFKKNQKQKHKNI